MNDDTIYGIPRSELGVWGPEVYLKLGLTLMKFIDRMGDPCQVSDPAEKICAEAYEALVQCMPTRNGPETPT